MTRTGPPTQKLNISSQASISKNRQVSFAPLQQPKATSSQVSDDNLNIIYKKNSKKKGKVFNII
jgi:hypothetical protein